MPDYIQGNGHVADNRRGSAMSNDSLYGTRTRDAWNKYFKRMLKDQPTPQVGRAAHMPLLDRIRAKLKNPRITPELVAEALIATRVESEGVLSKLSRTLFQKSGAKPATPQVRIEHSRLETPQGRSDYNAALEILPRCGLHPTKNLLAQVERYAQAHPQLLAPNGEFTKGLIDRLLEANLEGITENLRPLAPVIDIKDARAARQQRHGKAQLQVTP